MSERTPVAPADVEPVAEPTPKKQPNGMKLWFLKALAEDEEIQAAVATLVRENAEVRRAVRVICIEDILSVADKAPTPVPAEDSAFLARLKVYIRSDAIRSPYGL
jgi:hypothetical protein